MSSRLTKTQRVLRFIARQRAGARFSDIQRFVCEMNGLDYDEKIPSYQYNRDGTTQLVLRRRWRGYWCDYLLKATHYGPTGDGCYGYKIRGNLLGRFCNKVNGRYVLKPGVRV